MGFLFQTLLLTVGNDCDHGHSIVLNDDGSWYDDGDADDDYGGITIIKNIIRVFVPK